MSGLVLQNDGKADVYQVCLSLKPGWSVEEYARILIPGTILPFVHGFPTGMFNSRDLSVRCSPYPSAWALLVAT